MGPEEGEQGEGEGRTDKRVWEREREGGLRVGGWLRDRSESAKP